MKLTRIANKVFALAVVALVVAPLTSSFGFYDTLKDEILATDVGPSGDPTGTDPADAGKTEEFLYKFNKTPDIDAYDYENNLFKPLKAADADNVNTKLDDLGTMENPYIILELAPNVKKSEIRAYVKDSSVYGLTNAEMDAITLTGKMGDNNFDPSAQGMVAAGEYGEVRRMTREYMFYKKYGKTYAALINNFNNAMVGLKGFEDFYTKFPKNSTDVNARYPEMMEYIEEVLNKDGEFDKEYAKRLRIALEDKKIKEESDRVWADVGAASFGSAWNYRIDYKVSNGKFETYGSDGTKTSSEGIGNQTQEWAGEYKINTEAWGAVPARRVNNNTFIKGCITLGYYSETYKDVNGDDVIVPNSMYPFVDEYIFRGWYYYDKNGDMQRVKDDTNLKELGINDLYTYWTARNYEQKDSYQINTGNSSDVVINYGSDAYTIHLPSVLASRKTAEKPYNNPKNQLSFKVIDQYKGLQWYTGGEGTFDLVNTISAWDMTFKIDDIKTGADLLKIAPILMSDTDYYVETFNTVVELDEKGNQVVNYYPYNVQVITVTPQDLNAMVYYDYDKNGWSYDDYHGPEECTYLNKFINDIDLIYTTNGNNSLFGTNTYQPQQVRFPTLYDSDGTYHSDRLKDGKLQTKENDIEWQVAFKIYTRALDNNQGRRVSMVMDRTTYSASANMDGGKAVLNLDKIYMFYFEALDPTLIYNMYVIDSEEWRPYGLRKVKGDVRDADEGCPTHFTGSLYDQKKWGIQLFYPYEILAEVGYPLDHKEVAEKNLKLGNPAEYPWGYDITQMIEWYYGFGLSWNLQPTTVVNYYARTFIGGNNLGQGFAKKDIHEEFSIANDSNSNNTTLMFDYFGGPEGVRPSTIVNDQLSTENAIEFMIQIVRQNKTTANDREINIRNATRPDVTVKSKNTKGVETTFKVKKVVADMSTPETWVMYDFYTSNNGYYVPEYYWTPTFQKIDNINATANVFYKEYVQTTTDPELKWVRLDTNMPSKFYPGVNMYNTFDVIFGAEGTTSPGDIVDFRSVGLVHNISSRADRKPYQFLADYLPTINGKTQKGQYVIVVQCYQSQAAYLAGQKPDASKVTMHNVIIDKAKYLFNLD